MKLAALLLLSILPAFGQIAYTPFVSGSGVGGGGGGGGTPGGSSGQLQWNNAGSFAGVTPSGLFTFTASTGVAVPSTWVVAQTATSGTTVDVAKLEQYYAATGNVTLSLSGTPTTDGYHTLDISADAGGPYTITLSGATFYSIVNQSAISTVSVPASGTLSMQWRYVTTPSARVEILRGDPVSATGTGAFAKAVSPAFTTPSLGAATALSINTTYPGASEVSVASASTVDLGAQTSDQIYLTGTTTITSFGTTAAAGRVFLLRFAGAAVLTNGSSLICPGAANITPAANDTCLVRVEASNVYRVVQYTRAATAP